MRNGASEFGSGNEKGGVDDNDVDVEVPSVVGRKIPHSLLDSVDLGIVSVSAPGQEPIAVSRQTHHLHPLLPPQHWQD